MIFFQAAKNQFCSMFFSENINDVFRERKNTIDRVFPSSCFTLFVANCVSCVVMTTKPRKVHCCAPSFSPQEQRCISVKRVSARFGLRRKKGEVAGKLKMDRRRHCGKKVGKRCYKTGPYFRASCAHVESASAPLLPRRVRRVFDACAHVPGPCVVQALSGFDPLKQSLWTDQCRSASPEAGTKLNASYISTTSGMIV